MELPREPDVSRGIHDHHHPSSPPPSSSEEDCADDSGTRGVEIILRKQFAAALMSVHAKEKLIREHAKVSEEAVSGAADAFLSLLRLSDYLCLLFSLAVSFVSLFRIDDGGWEKAEEEAASLREQLEATARENFSLENRVLELDAALKQFRRNFRISMEHQEKGYQDILTKRTEEWRSEKFELENLIIDLAEKLQVAEKIIDSPDNALRIRLRNLEMENEELRLEILSLEEQIEIRTAERDLIRHHLESIVNAQSTNRAEEIKPMESDEFREIDDSVEMESDKLLETEKLVELQKKITELEKKIENEAAEKSEMEKRLVETRDDLLAAKRQVEETERMVEKLQHELHRARNEADAAESKVQEMQEKVRRLVKKGYGKNVSSWR